MPRLALLWPSKENYERFRQVCDAELPSSYDTFERVATQTVRELEARGYSYRKVDVDPDDMLRWCMHNYGVISPESRAAYAAFSAELAGWAMPGCA